MKVVLHGNGTKDRTGELIIGAQPLEGGYIKYGPDLFAIHRMVDIEKGIQLMAIATLIGFLYI